MLKMLIDRMVYIEKKYWGLSWGCLVPAQNQEKDIQTAIAV